METANLTCTPFIWKKSNGWIYDFASISSTEPKGDFNLSTLASERILSGGSMGFIVEEKWV